MAIRNPEQFKAVKAALAICCVEGAATHMKRAKKAFYEEAVMNG